MEVHRIPLALRLLPRIRQRVICFHLRECASYGAWAGMQAFMVFPCMGRMAQTLQVSRYSESAAALIRLQRTAISERLKVRVKSPAAAPA